MPPLITGLLLLLGLKRLQSNPELRGRLVGTLGAAAYRIGFAALALAGLALIVAGRAHAAYLFVWLPPAWLHLLVLPLMFIAFACIAAEVVPSNLKRFARRPFLWGVLLWAIAHLLVKSDLAAMTMFGGFGLLVFLEIGSGKRRGLHRSRQALPWLNESFTVALGGVLFIVFFFLHADLFGVSPSMMGSPFI